MKKSAVVVLLLTSLNAAGLTSTLSAQTVEVVARPDFAPHMQALRQQRMASEDASQPLMQQLAKIKSFSADYQQRVYDIQQQLLQEGQGKLALKQHARFRFESETPEQSLLVSDGKTLWFYNELLEQVSIYDANSEVGQTPFALLTSTDKALWQQYQVTQQQQSFFIHPLDAGNPVQQLMLTFKDDQLVEMQVIDINQQQSVYLFSKIKVNSSIADKLFTFTVSKNLDVDDQRQR
ncbi:outer membrane lipoprotein chaperone LolA [Alishewanella sp. SMS8]|uniref:outer membrane lipoprotein chaperone LolA n=1 Tax=unclassified Alishewanella TaxID=2628974 RepID=UPI0027406C92|nr:outer membrane lipoprotein chaperone LolA [Alishewanella sp. SMS8]MDP4944551.1 outer membrane lipoprotein chaperone LolA [Alishewanella sp.]MDP5034899.1 outer membrane lipoprotein chaperone LolA [Alishewanella sp.]MDP5187813.1 outer membrane lipoprotein chaperone LolA [Alishewanella sp.]MDP5457925.1 outer membrane lipoprotein chaperone LolA [Alishewanella sp. SMS8]